MAAARRVWALMAILATIALTSFTVQAILEEGEIRLEQKVTVTGNAVAQPEGQEGSISEAIGRAANWIMEAE